MLKVIAGKKIDKSEISRILIRATNWIGDVVMSLPAIEAVRQNFPESVITVLAKPWVAPLLENHPAIDSVIKFRKGTNHFTNSLEMIRIIGLIRKGRYDLAILLQNAFEGALIAYLGRCRYRIGYNTDGRGFLLTHKVIRSNEILKVHQVEYYLSILKAMNWGIPGRDPSRQVTRKNMQEALQLMASNGLVDKDFLLGISPGAVFGEAKRWPPERFAKIGDLAIQKWGAKIVVLGSQDEKDICNALCESMINSPLDLSGMTSLKDAMGVISQCHFFLSNDSGLMHIAAALGVPTVAVFGSTDPVATGPRGPKVRVVTHDTECAPCLKRTCPKDYRCMLGIKPEEVWAAMEKLRRTI